MNTLFSKVIVGLTVIMLSVVFTGFIVGLSTVYYGWAIMMLWNWYMPLIFGLPKLTLPLAAGLGLVVGFLTTDHPINIEEDNEEKEKKWKSGIAWLLRPLLTVGIGWIILMFI